MYLSHLRLLCDAARSSYPKISEVAVFHMANEALHEIDVRCDTARNDAGKYKGFAVDSRHKHATSMEREKASERHKVF
jgi:hypothetical protein